MGNKATNFQKMKNKCLVVFSICSGKSEIHQFTNLNKKNLPASRAHSHRALRAQLASLASLSAPRARDLVVALRAPFFLDLALRARSCALHLHSNLFIII